MTALRFSLREAPPQRLDLSPLVPARLVGLDQPAIERLPLHTTRAALCVGDVFAVRMGDAAEIVIEGDSERLDCVGAGMDAGRITVEGEVGQRAGRAMRGGALVIQGSAGPFAASGMQAGTVEILGSAGDCLGAPLPGEQTGMAGGTVVVRGHCGARAGDRLRRGLIVVEGDAGDAVASRMVAGTVVVCGVAGAMAGTMMRRGTLLLGAEPAGGLLPTFLPLGGDPEVFRHLLAAALRPLSVAAGSLASGSLRRFGGDTAVSTRGELLLAG